MEIVLVCNDIRSTHNVGSLLRTADGFGVSTVYCCGLTPYIANDDRPPHIRLSNKKAISKTALGAENTVATLHRESIINLISELKSQGFEIISLEQSAKSVPLPKLSPKRTKIALILGTETTGLPEEVLKLSDQITEIPMHGSKESFNVSVAAAIALYELRS